MFDFERRPGCILVYRPDEHVRYWESERLEWVGQVLFRSPDFMLLMYLLALAYEHYLSLQNICWNVFAFD